VTYQRPSSCMRSPEAIDRECLMLRSFRRSMDSLDKSPHKFRARSTLMLKVFDCILIPASSLNTALTNQLSSVGHEFRDPVPFMPIVCSSYACHKGTVEHASGVKSLQE